MTQSTFDKTLTHRLKNGLTIVGEPMAEKRAAAWAFLIPSGAATEPDGRDGITTVLEGLSYRGAAGADGAVRNSRELSDALDNLGIDRGGGVDVEHTSFGGATLGDYLLEAFDLYADILRRPLLPQDEWEAQRELALHALDSLEDAPMRKMFVELRRTYFPNRYGRSPLGTREGLTSLTHADLRADHAARFLPDGAILAVAGRFDWNAVVERAGVLFNDWQGAPPSPGAPQCVAQPVYRHIAQETAQQQIGIAYAGVASDDPHFYDYRIALSVLSGGMGARLFTEVREKRGLVYNVSASAATLRGCGFTLAFASATPERSQETLDVLIGELQRMAEGVTEAEVERAKTGMLASWIMQEESSRARASGIARDQFMLGRVRSLDEVAEAINRVTPQSIAAFYATHAPRDFTVVTLGPKELVVKN